MKTFYEAIYEWVAENYGQSEADGLSWIMQAQTLKGRGWHKLLTI